MKTRAYHATLFALYQLSIVVGIFVMPLAMATRQAGYTLPIHRLIETVGEAYDDVSQE
ncbi:hypothetical protein GWG54_10365 [Natronococcus sp. JC468]|uniref:hypothetical protein n=1 Tax=Natronococcus sp. JC468 TaxID=1961921 RepID=UPI00143CB570|nr:hypothetical protein [Natronococcus sp. JC468]NKE36213.1 hypothetical protein [Natronococcus sp. JC468]